MIINGISLLNAAPIKNMLKTKEKKYGYSHGMSEAGYDIRIAQDIIFKPGKCKWLLFSSEPTIKLWQRNNKWRDRIIKGRFCLASSLDQFQMPSNLTGIVHDKSTWARQGLSVYNTVIEPGFCGGLTLELAFHGDKSLNIPAGVGIAQVIFHETKERAVYAGKYQNQSADPQEAILK